MKKFLKSEAGRRWVYGILVSATALAVGYGVITEDLAALWVAVGANVLGLPLALANVRNAPDDGPDHLAE